MSCVSLRIAAAVSFCVMAAGCAGPNAHDLLRPEVTAVAADRIAGTHDIFIATTRAHARNKAQVFDGQRSETPNFAKVTISVPAIHKTGEIERPKGRTARPDKFFTATELTAYSDDAAFEAALRADLARHDHRALVFVHGYNNLFDDAVYRMTQLVHDSGFAGTPVLFSWASGGRAVDYVYDRDSATAARDSLEATLRLLVRAGATRIDIVAHSMGNFLLMETLRELAINGDRTLNGRLGDVILASPDIDVDVFKSQMRRYGKPERPFILLLSRDDRALSVSQIIAGDKPRLGDYTDTEEIAALGLVVVDLTKVSAGDAANHAKFANNPVMVKLLGESLKNGDLRRDPANADNQIAQLTEGLGNTLGATASVVITLPGRILDVTFGN
jgi:esterase/lipase superfamily enzyme